MERPAWLPFALVALVACAVHLPVLGFGFVFDDEHLVVNNAFLRQAWSPILAFQHDFWHGTRYDTSYYRPVATASLALNGRLLGWSPPAFHLVNILLHATNAVLLLRVARLLGASASPATAAALLFAVHPAAAWPVASVVARVDLLPACFVLLAWWSAARTGGWWPAALSGASFLAALLSKESAVAFLAVPWLAWLRPPEGDKRWGRAAVTTLAGLLAYIGLKVAAGLSLLPGRQVIDPTTNPLGVLPLPARIWSGLELGGRYLLYLLLPFRFTDPRDYVTGPLPGGVSPGVLLSAGAIAAFGLGVIRLWWRRSSLASPLAFVLLGFLPASNLLVPIGSLYALNFLYLPLLGLCLAAGLALETLRSRGATQPGRRRWGALVAAASLLVLALASIREASIWRDGTSLFSSWTRRFPRYALAHSRLGVARLGTGDVQGAEASLRQALQLDGRMVEAHYNLGVLLAMSGRGGSALQEALEETRAALALAPDLPEARVNASRLLLLQGRPVEAEAEARAALALDRDLLPAQKNLAESLFQLERFGEAAATFGALAAARPDDPSIRSPYVVALLRSGDLPAARAAAGEARKDFPGAAWFDFCLARVEILSGNEREALALLRTSLEKDQATRDWLGRVDDFGPLRGQKVFEEILHPSEAGR